VNCAVVSTISVEDDKMRRKYFNKDRGRTKKGNCAYFGSGCGLILGVLAGIGE
jgi:hypothetical protein